MRSNPARRILEWIVYRVRLLLLTVYGPATLDDEHDPIAQLKLKHERVNLTTRQH